jgi:hypothetical protein
MARPRNIESPKDLMDMWGEYKNYIDNNPDIQQQVSGKGVFEVQVKRPYLRQGFESFVFENYGFHIHQYIDDAEDVYAEFLGVVTHIRNQWQSDQIEGTLTGRYKAPNLVARLNGIADNNNSKVNANVNQQTQIIYQLSSGNEPIKEN